MLYYFYVSRAGVPQTQLVPADDIVWASLRNAENRTDKSGSAPSFAEIGGGWYSFEVSFGISPWDATTEDLAGLIDCDCRGHAQLADVDRYKPVLITKRSLALARIAHKAVQSKSSGHIDIYGADDNTMEMKLIMTDTAASLTRSPSAAS